MLTPHVPDRFTPADIAQVRLSGLLGSHVASVPPRLIQGQSEVYISVIENPIETGFWNAEHPGKWLEAACNTWKYTDDAALRQAMDDMAARLMRAQQPDGWLGSYAPEFRFHQVDWNGLHLVNGKFPGQNGETFFFDVWCNFLTLLGLLRYYETTADQLALTSACRIADLLVETFGEGKQDIMAINWDWGQNPATIIFGVARLYGITGNPRYLDFCRSIMQRYGQPDTVPIYMTETRQAGYPFDGWTHLLKHCEFELNMMGLCELYRLAGDPAALVSCLNIYDGYYAPQVETLCLHGFKAPPPGIQIPNTYYAILETCDVPTILRWFVELARLTGESRYLDAIEWNLYNAFLPRNLPDGGVNPGNSAPTQDIRNCCYSMLAVGLSYIPSWVYFTSPTGILVALYESSTLNTQVNGVAIQIKQKTHYPLDGTVNLIIYPADPVSFDLELRIPAWCQSAQVWVNNQVTEERPVPGTLFKVSRRWLAGDRVSLHLGMTPRVRQRWNEDGKAVCTVEWGPLLLALSQRLNPGTPIANMTPLRQDDGSTALDLSKGGNPARLSKAIFTGYGATKSGIIPLVFIPLAEAARSDLNDPYTVEFPL